MASTKLTRTFSAGNRKKWTMSMWVKRSKIGEDQKLMGKYTSSSDRFALLFNGSDQLQIFYGDGGSNKQITTNRLFRDTSAFYNFTFIIDTGNSTESDRMQIWVNGIRETSMASTTYPTLNQDLPWNDSGLNEIGSYSGGNNFDGILSHIHFSDGYAYTPSVFGEYDANGVWTINTSPSVTYGNNGFFILKDGNSVTDQSGNSNNFTVGGGTLTNTLDCPDNVFATLNPLSGSLSNNTLTQGNNTVETTSGWRWRPSTIAPSSGKYYAEFKPTSGSTIYTAIGVAPQYTWHEIDGETLGSGTTLDRTDGGYSVGYTHSGTVKKNSSTVYTGSSYTGSGDIIGVAMDLDNHKVYFSKNGVWQNSGDPTSGSTGTGAVSLNTTVGDWSMSTSQAGTTVSCNYGNGYFGTTAVSSAGTNASGIGIFEYDVPTGYTALSTKGLNL